MSLRRIFSFIATVICYWFTMEGTAHAEPVSLAGSIGYAAMGLGAGGGILASLFGGGGGDDKNKDPEFFRAPMFQESEFAMGEWQKKLQEWSGMPGYGAIAPDWADIWDRAQQKVNRYFWGGPEGGGVAGKIRASAARRNVSQSPAVETELGKMGMKQGQLIGDMATEEAYQKALFSEKGRTGWMSSMTDLAKQRVPGTWSTGGGGGGGASRSELLGNLGGAGIEMAGNYAQQSWMRKFMEDRYPKIAGGPGIKGTR